MYDNRVLDVAGSKDTEGAAVNFWKQTGGKN
jgi:hypothetical protein